MIGNDGKKTDNDMYLSIAGEKPEFLNNLVMAGSLMPE